MEVFRELRAWGSWDLGQLGLRGHPGIVGKVRLEFVQIGFNGRHRKF